jgi:hypothetical protein
MTIVSVVDLSHNARQQLACTNPLLFPRLRLIYNLTIDIHHIPPSNLSLTGKPMHVRKAVSEPGYTWRDVDRRSGEPEDLICFWVSVEMFRYNQLLVQYCCLDSKLYLFLEAVSQ